MKKFTPSHLVCGFIVTLIGLILNAGVANYSINTISENNRSVLASNNVLTVLDRMLGTVKNLQLEEQAYLTTNNLQQLILLRIELTKMREQLKLFENLVADRQQVRFRMTEIDRYLVELISIIDDRQIRSTTANRDTLSAKVQRSIESIRQAIGILKNSEQQELLRLQARSQKSLVDTQLAFGVAGILDLLLLIGLYYSIGRDLIHRQQSELKLQDYVAEFEELYHGAPCGYHSLDRTEKFIRINRTELQMLGYTEAEIVDRQSFETLLTPASIEIFHTKLVAIERYGWVRDVELEMLHKDGRVIPVSVTMSAVKDEDGNYVSSRSTVIDISERIRLRQQSQLLAEISQKIRQSLQLNEILATAVTEVQKLLAVDRVLIFRLETDGGGTVLQEQVLLGYSSLVGKKIIDPCFDLTYHARYQQGRIYSVDDITKARFQPCYVEFLQQFDIKASAIVPIHLRDELWGLLIVHQCDSIHHWRPNELEMLVRLATQIGIALAQAQSLEQERLQRQELVRSNAELEQFAHVASHDLQEPLRMVISYLQLLERRYQDRLDDDAHEFIDYAVDGAVRMQALLQALLNYARISNRGQPFAQVDTNTIVENAIDNLYVSITESAAIVRFDSLPVVWGDATQLIQLFQNLIANAIKFRRELPPTIEISARQIETEPAAVALIRSQMAPATAWCFTVTDNGIGIESQYLERIFAIFQRLHTRSEYPGTGVGLAICQKIVERHGGKIWVASTPDRGSQFSFIIPEVGSSTPPLHDDKQPHD